MAESVDPLKMLSIAADFSEWRQAWVIEAREAGTTWDEIAKAARMSRRGVIKLADRPSPQ